MTRSIKRILSLVLVLAMTLALPLQALAGAEEPAAQIVSTDMSLEAAKSNVQSYYSNEEWEKTYPDGLYIIEYDSYEIAEGGTDPNAPEDVYLGIVVYRIGGNSNGATVDFTVACTLGDEEMYPASRGTVEFLPQQTTATIKVKIKNDDKRNGNQLLAVSLADATIGEISPMSTTMVKVFDDEPYVDSVISMSVAEAVTDRVSGGVKVTIKRTENTAEVCSVHAATSDGTAVAGVDYEAVSKDVVFMPGQESAEVVIPLIAVEQYTQAKSLTLTLSDLKGCVVESADSIRLDITNKKEEPAKELVIVDDAVADLEADGEEALVGGADSTLNVNDTVDRTALLKTAIGSMNGTAVQSFTPMKLTAQAEEKGIWTGTVVVPSSSFVQRYASDGTWNCDEVFENGNEDLLLTTQDSYDLNQFDRITVRIRNQDDLDIRGNPNTAFGYLTVGGASDKDQKFYFIKNDLTAASPNISWMDGQDMYFLKNWNNSNIDTISTPLTLLLYDKDTNVRYHGSVGELGAKQKLFIISYDDEGWDDTNFYFEDTTLHRTVIPFSTFQALGGMEDLQIKVDETNLNKSTIQFTMDNYAWTIGLGSNGGVGVHPVSQEYGFYVGSDLNVSFTYLGDGGANVPIPQYLYMVDSEGYVQNSCAISADNTFTIPLETLLTRNITSLTQNYYMSDEEAQGHNANTMGQGSTINSEFARGLGFQVRYKLMQGVTVDYSSLPVLCSPKAFEDGTMETSEEWEQRILANIGGLVSFYRDGVAFVPDHDIYLDDGIIHYEMCEFDYLQVDPTLVGEDYRISSNLYDLDYVDIATFQTIEYDVCAQIQDSVEFRIYDPNAAYLMPRISVQSTSVSLKTDSGFQTVYTTSALDKYLPFEALYSDGSSEPGIQYYTVRFTVSDIYAGSMTGAVKRFKVNVGYSCPKVQEEYQLLSFYFKGGASFDEASDVELEVVNSKFKANTDVAEEYLPVLQLEDRTETGFQYVLYIPTYYNYQNQDDPNYQYYEQVFFGGDGITMEMADYDKGDGTEPQVITSLSLDRTQSVMTKVPDVQMSSDETEMHNYYFEEQNEFYTYNDHRASLSGYKLGVDPGTVMTSLIKLYKMVGEGFNDRETKLIKRFGGTTPFYIQFGNEQIVVGGRLTVNGYADEFSQSGGTTGGDQGSGTTGGSQDLTGSDNSDMLTDIEGLGDMTLGGNGASDAKTPTALQKLNTAKIPSVYGSVDVRMVFAYDRLNHQYDFNSIMVTGAVGISVLVTTPITPAPVFYVSFSTKIGVTLSTGMCLVKDYIDANGKAHYKATWAGVVLTPSVNFTLGLGVGISGIIAGEFGGSADISMSAVLGKQVYKPAQYEFDLDTVLASSDVDELPLAAYDKNVLKSAVMDFSGDWRTYTASQNDGSNTGETGAKEPGTVFYHSYGGTLCRSEAKEDKVTIKGMAASFQLLAVKEKNGGTVRVTVMTKDGDSLKVLKWAEVDLSASQTQLHQRVFTWEVDGFDNMESDPIPVVITIENISDGEGERVTLDSFRLHNTMYKVDENTLAVLSSLSVRLALYIKVTIVGINVSLEPGYMMINYTGSGVDGNVTESATLTMGSFYKSKTYDLMSLRQDEDLPVVMASPKLQSSTAEPDYFSTGEFAQVRTKTLLSGDIESGAKSQVISHGSDIYTFYTVYNEQEDGTASFYQLYWSRNGVAQGLVTEDVFVADFQAYIDGSGALALVMTTSDSTVSSLSRGEEGVVLGLSDGTTEEIKTSKDLSKLLQRTCVKTVSYDHSAGQFGVAQVIGITDGDGTQESLPVAASASDLPGGATDSFGAVFYVEDTKTQVEAQYDMNWVGFNDETADSSGTMAALMDSLYKGSASLYYSIDGQAQQIPLDGVPEAYLKPGFKITSLDALMLDEDTVGLAYSVEIPYAQKGGRTGTLKQIHFRKGVVSDARDAITFGTTVVVESVFDYDDELVDVFADATTIDPCYYNAEDDQLYDDIILRSVQLAHAALDAEAGIQPCLFYQTNGSIDYVTYDALEQKSVTGVLYDGDFENYVLFADEEGDLTIVYIDTTESGSFADTLYIAQYDSSLGLWNKPRALTETEAFDADAYARQDATAAVMFDQFSAFVYEQDGTEKVAVALKSSYVPFNYDYATDETVLDTQQDVDFSQYYDRVAVDDEGNVYEAITVPVLDYESPQARTDIFMITFQEPVSAVKVQDLELTNVRFLPGEQIRADFDVVNSGDTAVNGMNVSLSYYHPDTNSSEVIVNQKLTGTLLSGDRYSMELAYTVPETNIPDGTVLEVQIRDASGRKTLYHSYLHSGEDQQYHVIHDGAEFYFHDTSVEIGSDGIMDYIMDIGNAGTLDAAADVDVYFDMYGFDEEKGEYEKLTTLFALSVAADRLASGSVTRIADKVDVSSLLSENGKLYYAMKIVAQDAQYDTENDQLPVAMAQQIPEVELTLDAGTSVLRSAAQSFRSRRSIRSLKLGDEIVLNGRAVSDYFEAHDLEVYEVGSDCLSVDAVSEPGKIKIKVVAMPENGEGNIKLKVRVGSTVIDKTVFLQITNTGELDLDERHMDEGWTVTGEEYSYALEYDMITTQTNGSQLRFRFVGEDLKLYGDRLTDGGDLQITITDATGSVVKSETVTTAAELDDRGMLLYASGALALGTYDVTITALTDPGERVVLDHVSYKVDVSDADTTPYPVVRSTNEALDAPLLSGRKRTARFTLLFSEAVELAEGKSLEDLRLTFTEYESTGGAYRATGGTVTFVAQQILEDRVIFAAELSSQPGAVMQYVLSDQRIQEGFLVSAEDGEAVATAIPGHDDVSYVLKESGISSVMVAEDDQMPDGSVQKSVRVKFMAAPDLSRLEGTKLLYITTDPDGTERTIDFRFSGMTDDPAVAIYRADKLELAPEELSKRFAFQKGIVLNEKNYVLVTAEGDYLENDVTTVLQDSSMLDITYDKIKAASAPWIGLSGGAPAVYVSFGEAVEQVGSGAYVMLREKIQCDGESTTRQIRAELDEIWDGKTLVFRGEGKTLPQGATVSYALVSDEICYDGDGAVVRSYDGIRVDPALKQAQILELDTDVLITGSRVYLDGGMKAVDSVLLVDLTFSAVLDEQTLAGTTVEVVQETRSYDLEHSTTLTLGYESMKVVDGVSVATYRCAGDVSFTQEEIGKKFQVGAQLNVPDGKTVMTEAGLELSATQIADRGTLEVSKAAAQSAQFALVEEEAGYRVQMTLVFPELIQAKTLQNVTAVIEKEGSDGTEHLAMALESCEDGVLTFLSDLPLSLAGGEKVTFRTPERFQDIFQSIVDPGQVGVSTLIPAAELTVDKTGDGLVKTAQVRLEQGQLVAEVSYDEVLLEKSFRKSTVDVSMKIFYADGQGSTVSKELTFQSLKDENTAVYAVDAELPEDMASVELILGDQIDTYGGNSLYNVGQTLRLSTALPKAEPVTQQRMVPQTVQIQSTREDGTVKSLADTQILVTYPQTVQVTALEGISLVAQVAGVEGVESVTYQAVELRDQRTLVLRCVDVPQEGYGETVEVTLSGAKLILADGTAVCDGGGMPVSTGVPDGSQSFPVAEDAAAVITWVIVAVVAVAVVTAVLLLRKRKKGN